MLDVKYMTMVSWGLMKKKKGETTRIHSNSFDLIKRNFAQRNDMQAKSSVNEVPCSTSKDDVISGANKTPSFFVFIQVEKNKIGKYTLQTKK